MTTTTTVAPVSVARRPLVMQSLHRDTGHVRDWERQRQQHPRRHAERAEAGHVSNRADCRRARRRACPARCTRVPSSPARRAAAPTSARMAQVNPMPPRASQWTGSATRSGKRANRARTSLPSPPPGSTTEPIPSTAGLARGLERRQELHGAKPDSDRDDHRFNQKPADNQRTLQMNVGQKPHRPQGDQQAAVKRPLRMRTENEERVRDPAANRPAPAPSLNRPLDAQEHERQPRQPDRDRVPGQEELHHPSRSEHVPASGNERRGHTQTRVPGVAVHEPPGQHDVAEHEPAHERTDRRFA